MGAAAAEAPGTKVVVTSQNKWGHPCIPGLRVPGRDPEAVPLAPGNDQHCRRCLSWTRRRPGLDAVQRHQAGQASPTEGNLTPSVTGRLSATLYLFQKESEDWPRETMFLYSHTQLSVLLHACATQTRPRVPIRRPLLQGGQTLPKPPTRSASSMKGHQCSHSRQVPTGPHDCR